MKTFLTSSLFLVLVLLLVCFAHFVDALSGRDWHVFLYGALTVLLLVVFLILIIGGNG